MLTTKLLLAANISITDIDGFALVRKSGTKLSLFRGNALLTKSLCGMKEATAAS